MGLLTGVMIIRSFAPKKSINICLEDFPGLSINPDDSKEDEA